MTITKLRNNMRGDTIVEVLVVLAILSFAFSISYATANRSLLIARNAQEHAQALQYIDSQVELLRSIANDPGLYAAGNFCMTQTAGTVTRVNAPGGPCTVHTAAVDYAITISYAPTPFSGQPQDDFTVTIKWDGLGNLGPQQEHMLYKVHNLSS